MKKILVAMAVLAALTGMASAADLAPRPYTKAPVAPVYNWTGFYVFGGGGGGMWAADSSVVSTGAFPLLGPAGTEIRPDRRLGGSGWLGTVGIGYDWQLNSNWVAGVFADGQFGELRGSFSDSFNNVEDREKLRTSYAAGVRLGYLVAPNVLSYVNAGYSGSEWSGANMSTLFPPFGPATLITTPSFRRDGWFIGGGVENSLNIFGINAPGWFMKTEYRSAYYDRITLTETATPAFVGGAGPTGTAVTFKPWVQTVSTSLVYRFNGGPGVLAAVPALPVKAPLAPVTNWNGFYAFGGGGGGLWNADSNLVSTGTLLVLGPAGTPLTRDLRLGGLGWFGTVGAGYDWQFNSNWVAGVFADGQFGDIRGSISDSTIFVNPGSVEKLRTSYAAGARLGYLVAPNVLSYVNAGYSGSEWSGATLFLLPPVGTAAATTPSFRRDGWFVGGGVENSLSLFGLAAPGWFMKTEYRSAFYDRITLPETTVVGGALNGVGITFKPWVQTISTSIVYRFNWGGPSVVAKY